MPLAGALGVIVHVPIFKMLRVVPDTVQTLVVDELKPTVAPEVDVALNVKVPPELQVTELGGLKVMVWVAGLMVMEVEISGAAP